MHCFVLHHLGPKIVPWDPEQVPGTTAVALHGFTARSEDELSFYPGQRITIAPMSFQRKDLQGRVLFDNFLCLWCYLLEHLFWLILHLKITGWLLARVEGSSQIGLVPFNYLAAASQTTGMLFTIRDFVRF